MNESLDLLYMKHSLQTEKVCSQSEKQRYILCPCLQICTQGICSKLDIAVSLGIVPEAKASRGVLLCVMNLPIVLKKAYGTYALRCSAGLETTRTHTHDYPCQTEGDSRPWVVG